MICDLTQMCAPPASTVKKPVASGVDETTIMTYLQGGGEVHINNTKEKFKVLNFSLVPNNITVLVFPREGPAIVQKNWDFLRIVINFQNGVYSFPPEWYKPLLVVVK